MVLGEKESAPCERIGPPVFSADGKHVNFGVLQGSVFGWKALAR
jgi:hypothetical protein